MNTCLTCAHRSAHPESTTISGRDLYDCRKLNGSKATPRLVVSGAHAPWVAVQGNFGCVLWRQRKDGGGAHG